ncbi:hypothetical protein JXA47_02075 [Candidatus Sumerlaeota bacterium]|nr:hypothetical protein [Candidatus Sumerlaeota bacterium]
MVVTSHRRHPASAFALRALLLLAALAAASLATTDLLSLQLYAVTSASQPGTAEERIETLHRALRLNPAQGWAWHRLAQLELGLRNLEEAQRAAEMATLTVPSFRAHSVLAQILFARSVEDPGVRFEAAETFDRILRISPSDIVLLNRAARIALWNDDLRAARRYLDRLERFDIASPGDPETLSAQDPDTVVLRMELARAEGDKAELLRLIELLLTLDPGSPVAAHRCALLLADEFDAQDAAYAMLRDHFVPNLLWPDYVQLLSRWALARRDHWVLWRVLGDLWQRQTDRKTPDPGLNELVDNVQRTMVRSALGARRTDMLTDVVTSDRVLELARNPESSAQYDRFFWDCIRQTFTFIIEVHHLDEALRIMTALLEQHRVHPERPEALIADIWYGEQDILQWEELSEDGAELTLFLRYLINRRIGMDESDSSLETVLPQALRLLAPLITGVESRAEVFGFLLWFQSRLGALESPPDDLLALRDQLLVDIADELLRFGDPYLMQSFRSHLMLRASDTTRPNSEIDDRLRQFDEAMDFE